MLKKLSMFLLATATLAQASTLEKLDISGQDLSAITLTALPAPLPITDIGPIPLSVENDEKLGSLLDNFSKTQTITNFTLKCTEDPTRDAQRSAVSKTLNQLFKIDLDDKVRSALEDFIKKGLSLKSIHLEVPFLNTTMITNALALAQLTTLELPNCQLDDEKARIIGNWLRCKDWNGKPNDSLKKLDLRSNKITSHGIYNLCTSASETKALQDLDLRENPLSVHQDKLPELEATLYYFLRPFNDKNSRLKTLQLTLKNGDNEDNSEEIKKVNTILNNNIKTFLALQYGQPRGTFLSHIYTYPTKILSTLDPQYKIVQQPAFYDNDTLTTDQHQLRFRNMVSMISRTILLGGWGGV